MSPEKSGKKRKSLKLCSISNVAAGAHHSNSYLLCDEEQEYQPTDNEH